jgi:hypothetical protein
MVIHGVHGHWRRHCPSSLQLEPEYHLQRQQYKKHCPRGMAFSWKKTSHAEQLTPERTAPSGARHGARTALLTPADDPRAGDIAARELQRNRACQQH